MKLIEILKENVFIKPHFDNTISKEDRLKYREIISKKIGIKSREIIIHRISNDNR
jgi:radical SAM superfamily enzyme